MSVLAPDPLNAVRGNLSSEPASWFYQTCSPSLLPGASVPANHGNEGNGGHSSWHPGTLPACVLSPSYARHWNLPGEVH